MKILQLCVGVISTNCYIVYDEKTMEGMVIDPGDQANVILEALQAENVQLKFILLTHGHFDHILAAHKVQEATGAQLVMHKADIGMLQKEAMGDFRSFASGYVEPRVDVQAEDGTTLHCGHMTAVYLHTPGHTPGSSTIQIGDVLFTGDTMFRHECGRCDLAGGDFNQMLDSLARLSRLEGDYQVLPGHEAFSTLEEERQCNPYVKQALAR